jgi:hypothetical protein
MIHRYNVSKWAAIFGGPSVIVPANGVFSIAINRGSQNAAALPIYGSKGNGRVMKRLILILLLAVSFCAETLPGHASVVTTLNVASFGATGDAVQFSVNTVSNSAVVTATGNHTFSPADIGKVIEVFGAGQPVYYNGTAVVTQQDIICLITNVTGSKNLTLTIPCGRTMNAYCVVGSNNGPAFQSAINEASSMVGGQTTNVAVNIPAGTYLMVSSNVLNPNYVMGNISDTHPALTISSGGITLAGDPGGGTILMGCGAGMEHLVSPGTPLTWISPNYAPYVPMRDTLIMCVGAVANNQYPLVFQNLTFDGGLTNGQQGYNYWTIQQGNGAGWDTTHHAVADFDGYVTYQMNMLKVFTNCVFQHWRGEMVICWTSCITNAFNDFENCTFTDGNATADNMYYGQNILNCTFNGVGKVMEYYQANANEPVVISNCIVTNISQLAGPGNLHYDIAVTGATTARAIPNFTIENSRFYDSVGMYFVCLNAGCNVSVVNNLFSGQNANAVTLTYAGQQPSDGTQVQVMNNILVANNTFQCSYPVSDQGFPVENMMCSNNTGFYISMQTVFATNVVLSGNTGVQIDHSYDIQGGPVSPSSSSGGISGGQYMIDEPNNNWVMPIPYPPDAGDYFQTNYVSYGNGRVHQLQVSGSVYYLDDLHPNLNPVGAILQVYANTWSGANITNFYTSATAPGTPVTITNGASPVTFFWTGSVWTNSLGRNIRSNPGVSYTSAPNNGPLPLAVQFESPAVDNTGNAIAGWAWSFGDGTTSSAENPSHTYTATGTFNPSLTVTNVLGAVLTYAGPAIAVGSPGLAFTIAAGKMILAWSTNTVGYVLQYTTNIQQAPVIWNNVPYNPAAINGQNVVTDFFCGPLMFFRLAN